MKTEKLKKGGSSINRKIKSTFIALQANLGFLLVLCGLLSFTLAGFLFNPLVGLVILGADFIYLGWLFSQREDAGGAK